MCCIKFIFPTMPFTSFTTLWHTVGAQHTCSKYRFNKQHRTAPYWPGSLDLSRSRDARATQAQSPPTSPGASPREGFHMETLYSALTGQSQGVSTTKYLSTSLPGSSSLRYKRDHKPWFYDKLIGFNAQEIGNLKTKV